MADYLVTGKKGNGKSLICVAKIRKALMAGLPVATNLDLDLVAMLGPYNNTARVFRLPDKPTRADFDAIGTGNPDPTKEDKNGVVVLDECATWLNARSFNDKSRQPMLEWLAYSRKLGWDTYLIAQNMNQIDKQVREALVEYHVIARRLDRVRIPLLPFHFPKIHMYFVKWGLDANSVAADKWMLWPWDLQTVFDSYSTIQVFSEFYPHSLHMMATPWQVKGRYLPPERFFWKECVTFVKSFVRSFFVEPPRKTLPPKKKLDFVERLMSLPEDQRIPALNRLSCKPL